MVHRHEQRSRLQGRNLIQGRDITPRTVGTLFATVTLALLVGCGSGTPTATPTTGTPTGPTVPAQPTPVTAPVVLNTDGQAVGVPTASYPYAVTVRTVRGDTPESLQQAYDARIVSFQPSDGFALLATKTTALPSDPTRAPVVEKNANTINGGGMTAHISAKTKVWLTGGLQAWTTAKTKVWLTGQYMPVPENTNLWKQVNLEAAQAAATTLGAGVKVAVIDTGIDPTHPAFEGALAPKNEWHDFYDDDADPTDIGTLGQGGYGHGTSTAGIVLQVAPKATILPLRALGPDGGGDVLSIARAIDWAVARGSNVINLSLGSSDRSTAIQNAIDRAGKAGVLVVAAAGNDNRKALNYPAADAYRSFFTLSVGSVNGADVKSDFSNYGTALELTAPGEEVYGPAPGKNAQGYWNMAAWSGTSMSAPMVSGALALELSLVGAQRNTIVTAYQKARLLYTTAEIEDIAGNKPYKEMLGKGRLDIRQYVYGR